MMEKLKFMILISSLLCIFICGGCQMLSTTPEEKPANISLAALQDKMQKAMDPDGVFRKSKSYVQRQIKIVKKDWEDEKGYIVETKYKRPDKLKMTTWENNAPKTSIIFNGTNAWIVNYDSKFRKKITGDDLEKMKVIFLLGRPGSTYQEIFKDVQVAEVEIDEQPYYKLNCISKFKDQPPFIVYVGKNNFLTKRIDIPPKVTSTIEKYGLYDGVIIPERISEQLGDSETQYRLIMYKLNVEINDSDFFPPLFE